MTRPAKVINVASNDITFAPRSVLTPQGHNSSRRAEAQAHRRGLILAAVREMLAEGGLRSVNIRTLARRSGVTPPTIYNLIGAREDVVLSSMRETVEGMAKLAMRRAKAHGINEIIAYCDTVAISLAGDPQFYRQINQAAARTPKGERLVHFFEELLKSLFLAWLRLMKARGDLRSTRVDLDVVASILVHQQVSTSLAWAGGEMNVTDYRRELVTGAGLVLMGLAAGREAAQIELWLARLNAA